MNRKIIFNDQITVWWEISDAPKSKSYTAYLNGKEVGTNDKTHFTFEKLSANTEYQLKIVGDDGAIVLNEPVITKPNKTVIDVTKAPYNAVGDGKTFNRSALQQAFDDCDKNSVIYVPKGVYLTGGLRMHSDSELYLEEGAILQGTQNVEDYLPKIKSRFEGLEFMCYQSLINMGELDEKGGANCFNVIIRGKGRLIGGGRPLAVNMLETERARLKDYIASLGDTVKEYENDNTIPGRLRGRLVNISNTKNVIVAGVGIEYGPSWNLHFVYSEDVTVFGCTFRSHDVWNGDGCDPDSSVNCAIFNCLFLTGDDCIAIKSGRNPEGDKVNRKTSEVYIFDCKATGHGICVGSEMSGGVENVYIWDCDMMGTWYGAQLKGTRKRGGFIRNIHVNRCLLPHVMVRGVLYNDDGEAAATLPDFNGFYIEDCTIAGTELKVAEDLWCKYVMLSGLGKDCTIKNVYFKNIVFAKSDAPGQDIILSDVENVVFDGIYRE